MRVAPGFRLLVLVELMPMQFWRNIQLNGRGDRLTMVLATGRQSYISLRQLIGQPRSMHVGSWQR